MWNVFVLISAVGLLICWSSQTAVVAVDLVVEMGWLVISSSPYGGPLTLSDKAVFIRGGPLISAICGIPMPISEIKMCWSCVPKITLKNLSRSLKNGKKKLFWRMSWPLVSSTKYTVIFKLHVFKYDSCTSKQQLFARNRSTFKGIVHPKVKSYHLSLKCTCSNT